MLVLLYIALVSAASLQTLLHITRRHWLISIARISAAVVLANLVVYSGTVATCALLRDFACKALVCERCSILADSFV